MRRGGGRTGGARGARGRAGGGEAGAGPAAPPGPGRAGGGAGRGQRRISALSIRLLRLAPASAPAPSDVRAAWPAPSRAGLEPRARRPAPPQPPPAASCRAPPAAPAPCPPAARAPPPNPRGGRRRCCPYCYSASSGRREPDQEPVSTRRPVPFFPPGPRACAPGAAAGGGGRGRHLDGPGTKEGAPGAALGAPSPAGRTAPQSPGQRVWLPRPRPSYLGRPAGDTRLCPGGRGCRGLGLAELQDAAGARNSARGLGAVETKGHRSQSGAHAVGALGAGSGRPPSPSGGMSPARKAGRREGGRSGRLARGPGSPGTRLSAGRRRRRRPPLAGPRARGSAESQPPAGSEPFLARLRGAESLHREKSL